MLPNPAFIQFPLPSPSQAPALKHHLNTAHRLGRVINFSTSLREQKPGEGLLLPFTFLELLGGESVILALGWILKRDESHWLL